MSQPPSRPYGAGITRNYAEQLFSHSKIAISELFEFSAKNYCWIQPGFN